MPAVASARAPDRHSGAQPGRLANAPQRAVRRAAPAARHHRLPARPPESAAHVSGLDPLPRAAHVLDAQRPVPLLHLLRHRRAPRVRDGHRVAREPPRNRRVLLLRLRTCISLLVI